MKPFDNNDDRAPKSVPEMIKTLWSLYMAMSLDPAMAVPAYHLRSAALALEETRRMALQICQDEQRRQQAAAAGCGKKTRKAKGTTRDRCRKARERDKAVLEWLRNATPASPWKH